MMRSYDGATVIDASGKNIGTVERGYADDSGALHFVKVKTGGLLGKHRLIPLDRVHLADEGMQVPYTQKTIMGSPNASRATATLSKMRLNKVNGYYASHLDKDAASRIEQTVGPDVIRERVSRNGASSGGRRSLTSDEQSLKDKGMTFFQKVMKDNIGMLSSYVAWNVLTSVVPIMVGLIAISGLALRNPSTQATVVAHLSSALKGVVTTNDLKSIVKTTTQHAGLLGIVGFLGVLWGGSNVGGAISTAFQAVFEVSGRSFIKEKLIDIGMIFVFTALMLVIIATTSAGALIDRLFSGFPLPGVTQFVIGTVIATVAALLLFTAIYLVFPNTEEQFKFGNVWRGAVVAAILFEALSYIWPLYAHYAHFQRYGAVLFPILLLTAWIYFFALILMIGAEVVAFSAIREANREQRSIGPRPENSVPQHEVLRSPSA